MPTDRGDIGRRAEHRRVELHLSVDAVAARAGMDPSYLRYLESHPAQVTGATVARLARALQTTPADLLGATRDHPSGSGRGRQAGATLTRLGPSECRALLGEGGVGRIVFVSADGPVALPVNYVMAGDDIVFRTAVDSPVRAAARGGRVSFEVDRIDDALREGWSVLATGSAREITAGAEPGGLAASGDEPWLDDDRPVIVRVHPDELTGRRVEVAGPGPSADPTDTAADG